MIALKRMNEFKDNEDNYSENKDTISYITTYCPDAYWILKVFGKKQRSKHKLIGMCDLLRE